MNAGRAAQRVHLKSGVIRKERTRRELAIVRRLQPRVLFETGAILFRRCNGFEFREGFDVNTKQLPGEMELAQFPRIACSAIDLHPISTAACWIAINSAIPFLASSVM